VLSDAIEGLAKTGTAWRPSVKVWAPLLRKLWVTSVGKVLLMSELPEVKSSEAPMRVGFGAGGVMVPGRNWVIISHHRQSRWYEEGPLKGPKVGGGVSGTKVSPPDGDPDHMAQVLFQGVDQGSHDHPIGAASGCDEPNRCDVSRRQLTRETAEPLGVSPPEAVDLFLIQPGA
jgi:hypothetical protein